MNEYLIAFWNVENLFGPENHPHRISWVATDLGSDLVGWTETLYQKKLSQLTKIITQMNDNTGPDILGVCEVEDHHVLGDLVNTINPVLPDRHYAVIHATADLSFRGIDTAFIYDLNRFTVDPDLVFNHFVICCQRRPPPLLCHDSRQLKAISAYCQRIRWSSRIVVQFEHKSGRSGVNTVSWAAAAYGSIPGDAAPLGAGANIRDFRLAYFCLTMCFCTGGNAYSLFSSSRAFCVCS